MQLGHSFKGKRNLVPGLRAIETPAAKGNRWVSCEVARGLGLVMPNDIATDAPSMLSMSCEFMSSSNTYFVCR